MAGMVRTSAARSSRASTLFAAAPDSRKFGMLSERGNQVAQDGSSRSTQRTIQWTRSA
jgi:hypothetical protein